MEVVVLDKTSINKGIVMPEVSEAKCLHCNWIGYILDLIIKNNNNENCLLCPQCMSINVKPYVDGKIYG